MPGTFNPEDGTITPDKALKLRKLLSAYTDEFNRFEITIKKIETKRTANQNRYYWGVIVLSIMRFWEETQGEKISKNKVHAMNLALLGMEPKLEKMLIPDSRGTLVEREVFVSEHKTTANMNTKEFGDFIDTLAGYWNPLGCYWMEPKETNYITEFLEE